MQEWEMCEKGIRRLIEIDSDLKNRKNMKNQKHYKGQVSSIKYQVSSEH